MLKSLKNQPLFTKLKLDFSGFTIDLVKNRNFNQIIKEKRIGYKFIRT